MSELAQSLTEMTLWFSADGQYYAIPSANRECGIWLSVETYPLPVPNEWRKPGILFAAVIRRRNYYRLGSIMPQTQGRTEVVSADSDLFTDYRDAAWWTPGLEETWDRHGMKVAGSETNVTQLTPKEENRGRKA